jgi:hypothetical protein
MPCRRPRLRTPHALAEVVRWRPLRAAQWEQKKANPVVMSAGANAAEAARAMTYRSLGPVLAVSERPKAEASSEPFANGMTAIRP